MADRPDFLHLTGLVMAIAGLVGVVNHGTAMLGRPTPFGPGLLAWPGLNGPIAIAGLLASGLLLVAVAGLYGGRPWAPGLGAGLGLLGTVVGLLALMVLAPLKNFSYPAMESLFWIVAIVASLWIVIFSTSAPVREHCREEEAFASAGAPRPEQTSSD